MGGIFGYACRAPQSCSVVGEGLRRLTYRGYDGAGFCFLNEEGRLVVRKVAGHLEKGWERLSFGSYSSDVALGHTRYASRGVPAEFNSHPLLDCKGRLAVVMDGFVNGYEELREELRRRGHRFVSTTDTEVLAHLLEELLERQDLKGALLEAARSVEGIYSAAVALEGFRGLGLISKGQPLVIGLKGDCHYVSSDIISLSGFADEAIVLEEGVGALVTPASVEVFSLESGAPVAELVRKKVKYQLELIGKGGYPHYMLKEIYEIPDSIRRTAASLMEKYLRLSAMILSSARNVIVIGNGTSFHAGLIAQYYFADLAGLNVGVVSAAEFPYYALENVVTGTVILAISQSGETGDVIRSVKLAKQRGAVIVGITNVLGSRLTMHSNVYLPISAGPEIAVPSTKTFASTLTALAILAGYVGLYTGKLDRAGLEKIYAEISGASQLLRDLIPSLEEPAQRVAEELMGSERMYVSSSGISYPVALEGALKLKEAALAHAEGVQLGELRHGPLAIAGRGMPILLIEPVEEQAGELYERVLGEISGRGARAITLGYRRDSTILLPRLPKIVAPLTAVVPLQLIAYKLGSLKGLPIDMPPGLAKVVTT
ncbi:MAG: glutamine--fructose-6-phosphate transaminase (isomerizing) [Acidilobaceae archaeon]|nr:glutamine--fructose-6-phosphate transaminase (isomerizing) [Acidilobaceae archaeon]